MERYSFELSVVIQWQEKKIAITLVCGNGRGRDNETILYSNEDHHHLESSGRGFCSVLSLV